MPPFPLLAEGISDMPLSPLCWRDGHNLILYGDWLVLIWIAEVRQEREASKKLRKGSRKERRGEERRREERRGEIKEQRREGEN